MFSHHDHTSLFILTFGHAPQWLLALPTLLEFFKFALGLGYAFTGELVQKKCQMLFLHPVICDTLWVKLHSSFLWPELSNTLMWMICWNLHLLHKNKYALNKLYYFQKHKGIML